MENPKKLNHLSYSLVLEKGLMKFTTPSPSRPSEKQVYFMSCILNCLQEHRSTCTLYMQHVQNLQTSAPSHAHVTSVQLLHVPPSPGRYNVHVEIDVSAHQDHSSIEIKRIHHWAVRNHMKLDLTKTWEMVVHGEFPNHCHYWYRGLNEKAGWNCLA